MPGPPPEPQRRLREYADTERYRLMVEAVRDYAIFMLDPAGHIQSWNRGAERLKGYRAEEIVGRHFSIFYGEEDRLSGHPADELRRALDEGRYEEEGWRLRKDGSRFWANVVITAVFDPEGRHIGFTTVTRDFTEARRYREAQIAVQVRDELLSIAGHELRTPLSAVLLHLDGLLRAVRPDDSAPRLRQRLEKAAASARRLERLIGELLDISRITGGRLRLEPELLDFGELVQEVVDRFADQAEHAGCPLTLRAEPGVRGTWDRNRLDQAVSNLLSNALKYGRGQPVQIEAGARDGQALLRVVDRGIGIAATEQQRIFERFERAVSDRDYGGFGVGLWIARQIVEASGGTVEVESEPGRGAAFTVRLPLAPPPQPQREGEGAP